ncbi:DMT family transporter [Caldimonas thermodepolymerans]|jgi:Permeases of the drug/metabolite transporter (DMT) superfamily|uniref:Drug/metabolite transporter (DMT)-like permease n=1 Tax=Caldimonas thermodepolymerans TaxID=215580 RepID=A0A2S5T6Z4_9BURK|nr:DMT family transporter [Caldimonas thermodepolymerans]PPE70775.1 EamA family transporter [Caldimonas thermodepolymerans]QPC32992.1 DMT family transporter [Caldimonas thermodepolymerans]RDI03776.1 drug/metabolite transporter (DMT)-like permease [Caldimonas thermodepolymerans]TCP09743.1 drug/metabolite transporter (DMT)-like permease [Caldimonas thermodepolymerans]UZG45860.1 DMT family transporter [Caldimonas thermodepolymerans]
MPADRSVLLRVMPWVFVLIWSTGFIVARYGMPYAPPLGFLCWRYGLSIACFLVWIRLARAPWPQGREQWLHLAVSGALMHGTYLGGVWAAVKAGMGAGTVALIVGLQPVLTAVWINATGSTHARVSRRQWTGLLLGLLGLVLVVQRKLGVGELNLHNFALALLALAAITVGTLYQKRHVRTGDARTANTVQLLAALAVSLPFALLESEPIQLHPHFIGALAWSVFGLTLGGSSLLYILIQRGAATMVTSLLYLVPPCTAVMAWVLFDEPLGWSTLAGMALTACGVGLVVRSPGQRAG